MSDRERMLKLNESLSEALKKNEPFIEDLKRLKGILRSFPDERDWRQFSQANTLGDSDKKKLTNAANTIYKYLDKWFKTGDSNPRKF